MSTAQPQGFRINVPDESLAALQAKLETTTFPDELHDSGWDYGVPLSDVKRLVSYWKSSYDWRTHEQELNNSLKQFKIGIEVEGEGLLSVHFVHETSKRTVGAIPLLFIHGWPGHFNEASKLIPLLTSDAKDHPSFHVVAISLPGYTFSEAPKKRGFGITKYAEVSHKLMLALGYDEYVVQGGDWGSVIGAVMARNYGPKYCKALHRNMIMAQPPNIINHPFRWIQSKFTPYTEIEKKGMKSAGIFRSTGLAYFQVHASTPQTHGYLLADSPVGLLAWILDKLHKWTDSYPFTDDEILTWVSLYWYSLSGPAASSRIYYEYVREGGEGGTTKFHAPIYSVPLGFSVFPYDINFAPKVWRQTLGNVVFDSEHASGGHFAAFEKPNELAEDLRRMFGKGGGAFGVIKSATGY